MSLAPPSRSRLARFVHAPAAPSPLAEKPVAENPTVTPVPLSLAGKQPRVSPRSDIQASLGDAAGFSLMVGIGETYIVPFALAVGAGKTAGGLAATMPMLAGATLQLFTPLLVRRLGSHRLWVAGSVFLQAIALLLL